MPSDDGSGAILERAVRNHLTAGTNGASRRAADRLELGKPEMCYLLEFSVIKERLLTVDFGSPSARGR